MCPDSSPPPRRTAATDLSEQIELLVGGLHNDPHSVLGAHPARTRTTIRAFRPDATAVAVLVGEQRVVLKRVHDDGVFAGAVAGGTKPDYRLEVTYAGKEPVYEDDPYRFLPSLGELDLHLIGEGRHEDLWQRLGAHEQTYGEVTGTSFAVWAPNAKGVRVIGDFNYWDGRATSMRAMGASGVWEIFLPGVAAGAQYKFEILGADLEWRHKADPLAFQTVEPPGTASVVFTSTYEWADAEWLAKREQTDAHSAPMSVYEVHLGSWRQGLSYIELAEQLVDYVSEMGFTHVELLPVAEHPFGGSWGYQVSAYYAPTARFGTPDEFRYLVDRLHQAGVGVIVDWVPAHFPRDEWALARFDGTPLYEHWDPRRGAHPDWGTLIFNFARFEVRNFLIANALFWIEEFHIDGLRVDAVASMLYLDYSREEGEWVPNEYGGRENLDAVAFLQEMNAVVYRRNPGAMTFAEESTAWPAVSRPVHLGGLGFGFKWNMGWMHDALGYCSRPPVYRAFHHHQMTFAMMYAYSENYLLPLSHDEVVHGKRSLLNKMPGSRPAQLATLRTLLAYMWAHPGKQLVFMGAEIGQEREWSHDRSLDWELLDDSDHAGLQHLVRDLNRVYRDTPAMWEQDSDPAGFEWIDANDANSNVFSFVRRAVDGGVLACVSNFAGLEHGSYKLGLPYPGRWREVVNTDAEFYGGQGIGNLGEVTAVAEPWHGEPAAVELTLPPLSTLWFRFDDEIPEPAPDVAPATEGPADKKAPGVSAAEPPL